MICKYSYIGTQERPFNKYNSKHGGNGRCGRERRAAEGRTLSIRARATLYLSSHRSPFAGLTKKEIGFADFDPFVFGQRPAMRAGAEKCEGALIGRLSPAPARRSLPRESLRASVQGRLPRRTPICLGSRLFINLIKALFTSLMLKLVLFLANSLVS